MKDQLDSLPLAVAAKKMRTTSLNILMHIKRGMLKGVEEDGVWTIDSQSLEALMAKTGGGKAQDVCASGCSKIHACGGDCS